MPVVGLESISFQMETINKMPLEQGFNQLMQGLGQEMIEFRILNSKMPEFFNKYGKILTIRLHIVYVLFWPDTDGSPTVFEPVNGIPVSLVPKTYCHKS